MRAKWIPGLMLASGLVFSGQVHGHFGDRIFPILEITDDMLSQIELDGLIDEWPEVYGEPTLTPLDFHRYTYDPADLDFRIWLGWHDATDRIYVGAVFFDDAYWTDYKEEDWQGWGNEDSMTLVIDGDHSGGGMIYDGPGDASSGNLQSGAAIRRHRAHPGGTERGDLGRKHRYRS